MSKKTKTKDSTTETIAFLIKRSLMDVGFWVYIQEEVRKKLTKIIDNVDLLGIEFKDAFIEAFKFEYMKRCLEGEKVSIDIPSAFQEFPEECYQCGSPPVKMLLGLDDWVVPRDSDVWAVLLVCEQIKVLQENGFFDKLKKNRDADKLINSVFDHLEKSRRKKEEI